MLRDDPVDLLPGRDGLGRNPPASESELVRVGADRDGKGLRRDRDASAPAPNVMSISIRLGDIPPLRRVGRRV